MSRFGPRIVALPRQGYALYPSPTYVGPTAYTYDSFGSYGAFVPARQFGGFRFSFRQLPYDYLSGFHQDYYDWLMSVVSGLKSLIPEVYDHSVDILADTIGSIEAFILAAMARISVEDVQTIQKLSTSNVWQGASQFAPIMQPDLHAYLFRLPWMWLAQPKQKYLSVSDSDDRAAVGSLQTMRLTIGSKAQTDLNAIIPAVQATDKDSMVPAVQEAALLAILAQMQHKYQKAVNVLNSSVAMDVDAISKWRKRFQMVGPELLNYLQTARYSSTDLFVALNAPKAPQQPLPGASLSSFSALPAAVGWLPTGELDYAPLVRNRSRRARLVVPGYAYAPVNDILVPTNQGTPLPSGTRITPAESVVPIVPQGMIYDPVYYSATGEVVTPGRPMLAPRPAFVSGDTATLLGGNQAKNKSDQPNRNQANNTQPNRNTDNNNRGEARLFGYDPDRPGKPKKVGGCAP